MNDIHHSAGSPVCTAIADISEAIAVEADELSHEAIEAVGVIDASARPLLLQALSALYQGIHALRGDLAALAAPRANPAPSADHSSTPQR